MCALHPVPCFPDWRTLSQIKHSTEKVQTTIGNFLHMYIWVDIHVKELFYDSNNLWNSQTFLCQNMLLIVCSMLFYLAQFMHIVCWPNWHINVFLCKNSNENIVICTFKTVRLNQAHFSKVVIWNMNHHWPYTIVSA